MSRHNFISKINANNNNNNNDKENLKYIPFVYIKELSKYIEKILLVKNIQATLKSKN